MKYNDAIKVVIETLNKFYDNAEKIAKDMKEADDEGIVLERWMREVIQEAAKACGIENKSVIADFKTVVGICTVLGIGYWCLDVLATQLIKKSTLRGDYKNSINKYISDLKNIDVNIEYLNS